MKTFLYDQHVALGAKMVDFAGWEMPLHYESALAEHQTVREHVGIFDISHMGRIFVEGLDAAEFLEFVSTNRIEEMAINKAIYTVLCDSKGGAVDDVIIYRHQRNHFSIVVNASNRAKDLEHLSVHAKNYEVTLTPHFEQEGIFAVQGPQSKKLLSSFFKEVEDLGFMRGASVSYKDHALFISRTGYTGELGYEIYGRQSALAPLWEELLGQKQVSLKPIGLAARDILRLEMGYALYGHELSETIAPSESIAFWTVKWDKPDFLGKEALMKLQKSSKKRAQHGVILEENAIPRAGMEVKIGELPRGVVTSGAFSPSLQKPIAIIMIEGNVKVSGDVTITIRGQDMQAHIVGFPFFKK